MSVTIEIFLGIEESTGAVPEHNKPRQSESEDMMDAKGEAQNSPTSSTPPEELYLSPMNMREEMILENRRKTVLRMIMRGLLTVLVVVVAIYVPNFSTTMAFLGEIGFHRVLYLV